MVYQKTKQVVGRYTTAGQRQFIRFAIVGGTSFTINAVILNVLVVFAHLGVVLANALGFCVAVINSYLLNKYWTFRDIRRPTISQFTVFVVVAVIGLGLASLLMWIMAVKIGLNRNLALVITTLIVMIWNFTANRGIVFNQANKSSI